MSGKFLDALERANEIAGRAVVKELEKRGFKACYAADKETALSLILDMIPDGSSVGVPGSVTIRELGAIEALNGKNCRVFQHWGDMTNEERTQARTDENSADFFLTSANALTKDGEIISIDGAGNRVAGMAWGRGVLMFVLGINKLASNLEEGIRRARSAVIPNALRLAGETACMKTGRCIDCRASSRMCRALLILEAPTQGRDAHVIVVGENLGY